MGILVGFGTHLEAETVEEDEVAQVAGVVLERGHGQIAARLFKEAVPGGQPARADDRQSHVALLHGQRQLFQTHTLPQKKKSCAPPSLRFPRFAIGIDTLQTNQTNFPSAFYSILFKNRLGFFNIT